MPAWSEGRQSQDEMKEGSQPSGVPQAIEPNRVWEICPGANVSSCKKSEYWPWKQFRSQQMLLIPQAKRKQAHEGWAVSSSVSEGGATFLVPESGVTFLVSEGRIPTAQG